MFDCFDRLVLWRFVVLGYCGFGYRLLVGLLDFVWVYVGLFLECFVVGLFG